VTDFTPLTAARCRLGEAPVWVPSLGQLWWIDIYRDTSWRYDWQSGQSEADQLSDRSSFVVPGADGSAIGARQKGLYRVPERGQKAPLAVPVRLAAPRDGQPARARARCRRTTLARWTWLPGCR